MNVQNLIEELQKMSPHLPVRLYLNGGCRFCGYAEGWYPVATVRLDNVEGNVASIVAETA